MLISASRRTDIPAFHAEWMMNRLREGYVLVRNPYSAHQVSRVSLLSGTAEGIIFWTKDASNLLPHLNEIDGMGHKYMFQYTVTPYGRDIERQVDKKRAMDAFLALAARLGPEKVIWRYDPILLGGGWTPERHIRLYEKLCGRMQGATKRCVISFVDLYAQLKRREPWIHAPDAEQMRLIARHIGEIARTNGMIPSACAEETDFTAEGIENRGCIDREDVSAMLGAPVRGGKDAGQRGGCRCVRSVDIGAYDTCGHGCAYCYARTGRGQAECSADSPILGRPVSPEDRVTERREKPAADRQIPMEV